MFFKSNLYQILFIYFFNLFILANTQYLDMDKDNNMNYLEKINSKLQIVGCSKNGDIFWNFMFPFIEDQYVVKFFALKDTSLELTQEVISCGIQRLVPIKFFIRKNVRKTVKSTSHDIYRTKSEAYVFSSDSTEILKYRLRQISIVSASSKIILILTNGTESEAKEILKSGWNEFRVLHIILVHTLFDVYLQAFVHDPFVYNPGSPRGHIFGNILLSYNTNGTFFELEYKVFSDTMKRVLNDVKQYPLRICMFSYKGSAEIDKINNGTVTKYKLKDGEIMDAIVKTINFKPVYVEPKDGIGFGFIFPNKTMVGSLREIEKSSVDILGNVRAIQDYGQQESEFLFPVDEVAFSFLTPKMGYTIAISFFGIFHIDTSVALVVTYITVVILWYFLQILHRKNFSNCNRELRVLDIGFIIFGAMLLVPQKHQKIRHERNVFLSMLIFSMVICYHYQGKMVELLTSSKKSLDIDDVEALAKSDLGIMTVPPFADVLKDVATTNEDVTYKILYSRQKIETSGKKIINRMILKKDIALLQAAYICKYIKATIYSPETGEDLFHITKDGPPTRYAGHMVPKTSPYTSRFNDILRRLGESGLVDKWKKDELFHIQLSVLKKAQLFQYQVFDNIYTMKELWFIFGTWCICCCISIVVFVFEIFLYRSVIGKQVEKSKYWDQFSVDDNIKGICKK